MTYRTYGEYLRHPVFRMVAEIARQRDCGRCQDCGDAATEPHHLRYPPWGTFDLPSNLIWLCHPCHAKRHGKEPRA